MGQRRQGREGEERGTGVCIRMYGKGEGEGEGKRRRGRGRRKNDEAEWKGRRGEEMGMRKGERVGKRWKEKGTRKCQWGRRKGRQQASLFFLSNFLLFQVLLSLFFFSHSKSVV